MRKHILMLAICLASGLGWAQQLQSSGNVAWTGVAISGGAVCQFVPSTLPPGIVGVPYGITGNGVAIQTTFCTAPLTFSVSAGALPSWATLNPVTGVITGTPDVAATSSFTVQVLDGLTHTAIFAEALSISASLGSAPALPSSALLTWCTAIACTPGPGSVVTIGDTPGTALCPTTCNFTSAQLITAASSLSCGETLGMENQAYPLSGSLTFNKVCDQTHYITIARDTNDLNFPPEGTRPTPCYSGIPSSALPGYPAYPCTSPQRDMPYIQKTSSTAAINVFGTSYRFVGIEFGRDNSYDEDFGIIAMNNNAVCGAADVACMNAQPTFNIFDRVIIHGDPQRQTSHAIGLGGTRWVAVKDSYIYDIGLTNAGGGGDAQPFAWGNGKFLTNSGFGVFSNNFTAAGTEGNLFCGSFSEPLSPSTGFDGIPHDVWFKQDWLFKNLLWDTQVGQTTGVAPVSEGVSYPVAADQELIATPTAIQILAGQTYQVQTLWKNDSNGGLNRMQNTGADCTKGNTVCVDGVLMGNSTVGIITKNGEHQVGSNAWNSQNQVTYTYTACTAASAPIAACTGATTLGGHTIVFKAATSDSRLVTLGVGRTLQASSTITVVASGLVNQIALSPTAPDMLIQPSYVDGNGNNRAYCYTLFAISNFTTTSLTWKVDGITNGDVNHGKICSSSSNPTACAAPGANDSSAAYCSPAASGIQGNHSITVTSAAGTVSNTSVINVVATAPITGFDSKVFTSKNGFELKCGGKMLVENLLLENAWGSAGNGSGQGGQFFLIHPFNQNGCSGSGANCSDGNGVAIGYGPFYISDVTFRNIKGIHFGGGFVIGGSSNTLGIHRVSATNILCDDCSRIHWSNGFSSTYLATQTNGGPPTVYSWESLTNPMMDNVTHRHITYVGDNPNTFGINTDLAQPLPINYVLQDSFFASPNSSTFLNPNGNPPGSNACVTASGNGINNTEAKSFGRCFQSYTFNHLNLTDSTALANVFTSAPIWQVAGNSIGFVNYNSANGGDYRLCKGLNNPSAPCPAASLFAAGQANQASDSADLGADVAGLQQMELDVRNGLATPMSIATASLPDATRGASYSQTISVTGGTAPYTFSTPAGLIPAGAIDILDYILPPDRNSNHMNGSAVKYTHLDGGLLWWLKGSSGNPWDGELVDKDHISQWFTEGDSSNDATCNALTGHNCFTDPNANKMYINPVPLWPRYFVPGSDVVTLTPGPNRYVQTANCGADAQAPIDNKDIKGELQGPFTDVLWTTTFGGTIPDHTPYLLASKYIKGTSGTYLNREQYWLVQGYGQVEWCPATWNGSTYISGTCSVNATKVSGGAPSPNFGCGVPSLPVLNGLPAGSTLTSSPSFNLGDVTGTISGTPTTAGIYPFTIQVEDSLGHMTQKTFTITVH